MKVLSPPDLTPAEQAVRNAISHAAETGDTAVVRVHQTLPHVDPWKLLGHPDLDGRQVLAWFDDSEDRCFLAVAVLRQFELHGEERFESAAEVYASVRHGCFDARWTDDDRVQAGVPLFVGGFAFRGAGRPDDSPWHGWSDGTLWIPHALVHRHGDDAVLVVTECVCADDEPSAVVSELARNLARVSAAISKPHPATPATPALGGPTSGRDSVDLAAWHGRVAHARARMAAGGLDKVVLARHESWSAPQGQRFDPFATAVALRKRQARCTTFAFCRPDGGSFVGATPELLVRLNDRKLSTVALAGTARRNPGGDDEHVAAQLLASAKDRHEQQLVTRAIRFALETLTESLEISETPHIVELADVLHLQTRISGQLSKDHGLFELLGRLHPTPAVGGLPNAAALRWMLRNEGMDRGWYAGPVGWADASGNGVFAVAIRSVLLRNGDAWAFAGCGLVPDSNPDAEWRETLSKLQAVSHGLAVSER